MRRFLGSSILALAVALAPTANAEDWFRLNMTSEIHFGSQPTNPSEPGGGVNDDIAINVAASTAGREYGDLELDIFVSGVDSTYGIHIVDLPGNAAFDRHPEEYGRGRLIWEGAIPGSYSPTVVVRNSLGQTVVEREFEIVVRPLLIVSLNQSAYEVDVGTPLTIAPQISNSIGNVTWSTDPTSVPAWLGFNPHTGHFSIDVSTSRDSGPVTLTGIDAFDMSNDSASFTVKVVDTAPDTNPENINLASVSDVEPRSMATSPAATPTGYDIPVQITVGSGGEVSVANGEWATSGTISPGQSFRVRATSPDQSLSSTFPVAVGTADPVLWSVTSWAEAVRTITAGTSSADLPTLFGASWTNSSTRKRLVIDDGVTVSSTTSTTPALHVPNTMRGPLIIENNGAIAGEGGSGGTAVDPGGKRGGDGIWLSVAGVKIINNGVIAAGGGGGGAGGAGASERVTTTVRQPASGERFTVGTHEWIAYSSPPATRFRWQTGALIEVSSTSSSVTSDRVGDGWTYRRGNLRQTGSGTTHYGIYREQTTTQTVGGGEGGTGGKGARYPDQAGSIGTTGSPVDDAGAGGTGGDGGAYGAAGLTGSAGGAGPTNNDVGPGFGGGASGFAIVGVPAEGSVLGIRFGQ